MNVRAGRRTAVPLVVLVALLGAANVSGAGTRGDRVDGQLASGLPAARAPAPSVVTARAGAEDPLDADRAAVEALLQDLADAFRAGDPDRLRPLLHDPDGDFGTRWLARARDMAGLPLAGYELTLDRSLPDLTTGPQAGAGALLVNVVERHALLGAEVLGAAEHHLYLTLRRRDGRWTVASDAEAAALGLRSVDHLWDHGPVEVVDRDGVLVLHHPGQAGVGQLLDEAVAARDLARARWPLDWPGVLVVHVPADLEELGQLLQVSYPLDGFVAFATGTTTDGPGGGEVTGARVLLNTERFLSRSATTRRDVLVHEVVHVASRPSTGPAVPSWLEEGVAQVVGEQRSRTGTAQLAGLTGPQLELPRNLDFTTAGRLGTTRSYQLSWAFVDWLERTAGTEALGRFYVAAGRDAAGLPGTLDVRLDAAARQVYGAPLDVLVEGWRAAG